MKRLLLIPQCFGIIKIREHFGLPRPTLQIIFVSANAAIIPGLPLGAWTSNHLIFSNPLFIIVARIGHIVGLWPLKCTGWGYNSDADARQIFATG